MVKDDLLKGSVEIKVVPNSRKNKIEGNVVYIKAKAENNKANEEVVRFLSKEVGSVKIIRGKTSRKKLIKML